MHETDDWELVARAQAGDQEAFAVLVRRYQLPVVRFCQRMTRSVPDAEDLAQETFVRLYRHISRLRPEAKFTTVLFGIARNLTLNFLRGQKRRGWFRHTAPALPETAAPVRDQPSQAAHVSEIEAALEAGLARLSPDHREVLLLRELEGLDYREIARVTGCNIGTVRSRLARAREQLRGQIEATGGEYW